MFVVYSSDVQHPYLRLCGVRVLNCKCFLCVNIAIESDVSVSGSNVELLLVWWL